MILLKKLFGTLMVMTMIISSGNARDKDCVDCGLKEAPGAPLSGNKNIDGIAKVITQEGTSFDYLLTSYCMAFKQVRNNYQFKKQLTESMQATKYSIDAFWQKAGCIPNKIGGTQSPIVHLAAENATDRLPFLLALYKYYSKERGDTGLWVKAINAKNSRGHTFLDYINYLKETSQIRDGQKSAMNELIALVCSTGGVFSSQKNGSCPMRI
jgi:hypothetical protein